MLVHAESIESVQSQVRVSSKPAANDVSKLQSTVAGQTTGLVMLPSQEAALKAPLTSSPVKESDVLTDREPETSQVLTT